MKRETRRASIEQTKEEEPVADFIHKLYQMLNNDRISQIVHWTEEGTYICIRNRRSFVKFVLPEYFRHARMESFIRQLNNYGFKNVCRLKDKKGLFFRHERFTRGNKYHKLSFRVELKAIRRTSLKEEPERYKEEMKIEYPKRYPLVQLPTFQPVWPIITPLVYVNHRLSNVSFRYFNFYEYRRLSTFSNMFQTIREFKPQSFRRSASICSFYHLQTNRNFDEA